MNIKETISRLETEYGVKVVGRGGLYDMYDASGTIWRSMQRLETIERDCESLGFTLKKIKESHERLEHSKREVDGETMRDRIERILTENDLWTGEIWDVIPLPVVAVEINNGDWKHDHARADYILKECGFTLMKTEVTEEDGSDCYSAIHYYA